MSTSEDTRRDPALSVVPAKVLNENPIGAPGLEIAAQLLQLPLREVELAAELVTPWTHVDGSTLFWSLRQLARQVALDRLSGRRPARRRGGRGHVALPVDQLQDLVAYLAAHGPDATADRFEIARGTIYKTLRRHGIAPPVGKGGPGKPRPRKVAA